MKLTHDETGDAPNEFTNMMVPSVQWYAICANMKLSPVTEIYHHIDNMFVAWKQDPPNTKDIGFE